MRTITALALLALAGCANSSGVLPLGPDTFTVSTSASPGKGGVPAAKRIAYGEARDSCAAQGLRVLVLSEHSASPSWTEGMARTDLSFRCLREDDPEFKRQRVETQPDQVIETRVR
jgi:hypothetical protein